MSWVLVKVGEPGSNSSTLSEWQIDSESDIQSPPAEAMQSAAGSIAYTADRSVTYGLSNSGVWTMVSGGSSSGGSGGGSPVSGTTVELVFDTSGESDPYLKMNAIDLIDACMAGPVTATYVYSQAGVATASVITDASCLPGVGYRFALTNAALGQAYDSDYFVFTTLDNDGYPTLVGGEINDPSPGSIDPSPSN